jgi:hypothetical protein
MKIQFSKSIDLSRSEQYVLIIEVHEEYFSFFLYNPENQTERFFYRIQVDDKLSNTLSLLKEVFFDHSFFSYHFRKTLILNRTQVFTYIPNMLFEEKNKDAYMHFLFTNVSGKILHQTLSRPEITILHALPEDLYGFLQRSFPEASIVHHSAATIAWCQDKCPLVDGNRMIIYRQPDGMDVLCFSRQQLLLSNHFRYETADDAVYYALYIYKQLKFSQLKDFIYLAGAEEELQENLKKYIQNVVSVKDENSEYDTQANMQQAPFEITALAQFYE